MSGRLGENLRAAVSLLQEETIAIARESEAYEAVLAARVELVVLKFVGLSRAGEVESTSIGSLNVESNAVVVGSFRLAAIELGNLPDIVTRGGDWARCGVLTCLKGCGAHNAGSGSEERSDGSELHFDSVGLRRGLKRLVV